MHLNALGFVGPSYLKLESSELFLMFLASGILYNIYTYINMCMNDIVSHIPFNYKFRLCTVQGTCNFSLVLLYINFLSH